MDRTVSFLSGPRVLRQGWAVRRRSGQGWGQVRESFGREKDGSQAWGVSGAHVSRCWESGRCGRASREGQAACRKEGCSRRFGRGWGRRAPESLRGQRGAPRANSGRGRTPLLECKVAVRRATPASLNGPARDKEQGRALCGAPRSAPQGSAGSLPPLPRQVRSALKKRWHRWQDHHSLRVPVARAMSIPTSPTRISFHSIKQTAAV